mgnify:CR=1 FL=1
MNNIDRLQRKLDSILISKIGLSYNDLPDLVFLSDYTFDGMTAADIKESAMDVIDCLIDEGELPEEFIT